MIINGFLVVRRPHLNYLVPERDIVPSIKGVYYAGVDRQRWADVFDEDFYSKTVPINISVPANSIKDRSNDFTGIDVCQNANDALALLDYSNRKAISNELIAIRAASLDPIKGTIETNLAVEWLGYDFVRLGEWSLIAAGLFMYPQSYRAWLERVNYSGLFDDCSLLVPYTREYEQAVVHNQSEPLAPSSTGLGTVAIQVGRIRLD